MHSELGVIVYGILIMRAPFFFPRMKNTFTCSLAVQPCTGVPSPPAIPTGLIVTCSSVNADSRWCSESGRAMG